MKDPDPRKKLNNVTLILAHCASMVSPKPGYYAVAKGRKTGINIISNQCDE